MGQPDLANASVSSPENQGPELSNLQVLDITTPPALDISNSVFLSLPQPSPAHIMIAALFDLLFWIIGLGFATLAGGFQSATSLTIARGFGELYFRKFRAKPYPQPRCQETSPTVAMRQLPGRFSE